MALLRKDITYEAVWKLYREGHTTNAIAKMYGVHPETIYSKIKQFMGEPE